MRVIAGEEMCIRDSLVAGLTAEGAQRIVCALFLVPCQVIVGVQQVDEFAQMEADAPQLLSLIHI